MKIDKFMQLIKSGFDVSFNYKDVFYTISVIREIKDNKQFGIGSDNGFKADFDSFDSIPSFLLDDKSIADIIVSLKEDEIYY